MKKHNFSAGPSILPQPVFEKSAQAVKDYDGLGLSLLELSHRGKEFSAIIEKTQQLVKEVMQLPKGYSVLFLHGGASLQFLMVPYNLLGKEEVGGYVNTGTWSQKAIKEAKKLFHVKVLASSEPDDYQHIPTDFPIGDVKYIHYTSNNTIYGTQVQHFRKDNALLVADMSSDIFSRQLNFSDFDLIYASAQKNLGAAGTTMVVVKDEILAGIDTSAIPAILDYRQHIKQDSLFNTPATFSIYTCMLTLEWLQAEGGLKVIEARNKEKSALLYKEIERNTLFQGRNNVCDRSIVNPVFTLKNEDEAVEKAFKTLCDKAGIVGLDGHRSVGGYRASMYNALPIKSVQALVDVMQQLEQQHS